MKHLEELINESKPKQVKVYRLTNHHTSLYGGNDREYKMEGTLEELIHMCSYTLECGKSYEYEKGRKKININPKTIEALCKNLINAKDNAARNGYSGDDYTWEEIGTKSTEEEIKPKE